LTPMIVFSVVEKHHVKLKHSCLGNGKNDNQVISLGNNNPCPRETSQKQRLLQSLQHVSIIQIVAGLVSTLAQWWQYCQSYVLMRNTHE